VHRRPLTFRNLSIWKPATWMSDIRGESWETCVVERTLARRAESLFLTRQSPHNDNRKRKRRPTLRESPNVYYTSPAGHREETEIVNEPSEACRVACSYRPNRSLVDAPFLRPVLGCYQFTGIVICSLSSWMSLASFYCWQSTLNHAACRRVAILQAETIVALKTYWRTTSATNCRRVVYKQFFVLSWHHHSVT